MRIVRDKMQQTEPFTEPQDLHAFVSKLYVYLVDEMHLAMDKVGTHVYAHTLGSGFGPGGRAGCPLFTRSAVQSSAPPVRMLKCPWARH